MNKVTFLMAVLFLIFGFAQPVQACECIKPATAWIELNQAGVVLVGRVVDIRKSQSSSRPGFYAPDVEIKLTPRKILKGKAGNDFILQAYSDGCDRMTFERKKDYLVFAYRSESGGWEVSGCSRTKRLKYARNDLQEIRLKKESAEAIRILGNNKPSSL